MSTITGEVHVGDVGTTYRAKIQDAGEAFDPSAAISKVLVFRTAGGTLRTRDATVVHEAPDWWLVYTTNLADDSEFHDTAGLYKWQGFVTFPDGQRYHTTIDTFTVAGNLAAADPSAPSTGGPYATLASPAFTGAPSAPTPADTDDSVRLATTAFVQAALAILLSALPSSDPAVVGALWNDDGVLTISAGP